MNQHSTQTVYENLKGMLEDAITLRRPSGEIESLRVEIARFDRQSAAFEKVRSCK